MLSYVLLFLSFLICAIANPSSNQGAINDCEQLSHLSNVQVAHKYSFNSETVIDSASGGPPWGETLLGENNLTLFYYASY